jgi:hypothetical protein
MANQVLNELYIRGITSEIEKLEWEEVGFDDTKTETQQRLFARYRQRAYIPAALAQGYKLDNSVQRSIVSGKIHL